MKFQDFEKIMSSPRMMRYATACTGNTKRAMTLYRLNLRLSQELFTVISCFEIALRNGIDNCYTTHYGNDWLRNAAAHGGMFDTVNCRRTKQLIFLKGTIEPMIDFQIIINLISEKLYPIYAQIKSS